MRKQKYDILNYEPNSYREIKYDDLIGGIIAKTKISYIIGLYNEKKKYKVLNNEEEDYQN